jgi:transposase
LPIYFRYIPGNVIDVSTLKNTILELAGYGINIKNIILDAGYYSDSNINLLDDLQVPYVLRVPPNRAIYKDLISKHIDSLEDLDNLVIYRDRQLYCKVEKIKISNSICYAYILMDLNRKHDEVTKYLAKNGLNASISKEKKEANIKSKGVFIIISKEYIDTKDILPLYYTRQRIEQTFDVGKNYADLLPLRVHSEETLRGHLLLSFFGTVTYILINKLLQGSQYCADNALHLFRGLKANIFDKFISINEPVKRMNDVIKHLNIHFANKWTLDGKKDAFGPNNTNQTNTNKIETTAKKRGRPRKTSLNQQNELAANSQQGHKTTQFNKVSICKKRGRPRKVSLGNSNTDDAEPS